MKFPTYTEWRAAQVARIVGLPREKQLRYLRGITLIWGVIVTNDVEARCRPGRESAPANRKGERHGQGQAGEIAAEKVWQEANARILREKRERRIHPLNHGSRMLARDPAVVLEQDEGRTCKGCLYEYRISIAGDVERACSLGKYHGARCAEYFARKGALVHHG